MNIIQIVPRMLPAKDGMSDYALVLADGLRKRHGISTRFLTCHVDEGRSDISGFPVIKMAWVRGGFLDAVRADSSIGAIILHYSFFFYNSTKYGAPFWLLNDLRELMKRRRIKLIAIFHELPFIKTSGFLDPIKSIVAKGIARMADEIITPCAGLRKVLVKWVSCPVTALPVFSNIAEPANPLPLAARRKRMVVFGGVSRMRVYKHSSKALINACRLLGINEICDIGPAHFGPAKYFKGHERGGININEMGVLPAEEVSRIMSESVAGFFESARYAGYLGKSTVFASYSAHGMLPVTDRHHKSESDGAEGNRHYLIIGDKTKSIAAEMLQEISDRALQWYKGHNQEQAANLFASRWSESRFGA